MEPSPTYLEAPETDSAPSPIPPSPEPAPQPENVEAPAVTVASVSEVPAGHTYPSLYDTKGTTVVAIVFGIAIIGGIQLVVGRIFATTKDAHRALTHFTVSMVALIVGAYLTDLVISGPDTSLLAPSEKATILDFIKSTCLMVFAYFFGTKAASTPSDG